MTARTLTIPPFELPDGSNPETQVTISLVDEHNRRIQGIEIGGGQPIVDQVRLLVHQHPMTVDLWPQPEISPILNFGTSGDQTQSFYLTEILNRRSGYRHQFRTQIDSGGALTWAEFAAGQGPLEGGQLGEWQTHIADAGIHVPAGGTTGQALTKASDSDGDTAWATGGGGGGGEANVGANVGGGAGELYRDKTVETLNFRTIGDTATVEASVNVDKIELNVPAGTFDADGSAAAVQSNLDTHVAVVSGNPHGVTKNEVGLAAVDNTSDADKPVSTAQQAALDGKVGSAQVDDVQWMEQAAYDALSPPDSNTLYLIVPNGCTP